MTILLGLILLFTAAALTLVGTVLHVGGTQGFPFGVEVGIVGMIGLGLVRGDVGRRTASRRLRRVSERYQDETSEAVRDRDRLAGELQAERAHLPAPLIAPLIDTLVAPLVDTLVAPVDAFDGDGSGR